VLGQHGAADFEYGELGGWDRGEIVKILFDFALSGDIGEDGVDAGAPGILLGVEGCISATGGDLWLRGGWRLW